MAQEGMMGSLSVPVQCTERGPGLVSLGLT